MVVLAPPELVVHRCYKLFKGRICGKVLAVSSPTEYLRVPCGRCRNLVIFPQPPYSED